MDNQDYQKLLQYLKNLTSKREDYEKWATQFREYNDHIYRGERRVVLAYKDRLQLDSTNHNSQFIIATLCFLYRCNYTTI